MPAKRRAKGTGTLYKKRNGRYVLRFENPDGTISAMTLHDDNGAAITTYQCAVIAADKICKERERLRLVETKLDYLNQVAQAKQLLPRHIVKLTDVWDLYLRQPNRPDSGPETLGIYEGILRAFLQYCDSHQVNDLHLINSDFAGQYLHEYWQTNIAPRTYNRHLQALKLIFKTILKEDSPFRNFSAKPSETESYKPFTPEQINQIFAKIDDPKFYLLHRDEMRIMLMLGLAFGLRLHDAACFQWSYIRGDTVEFKPAKTKKHLHENLILPIPEVLKQQFKKAEVWRVNQFVLPNIAKRYSFNKSGISQDVAKLLTATGIETKEEAGEDIRRMRYIDNSGVERTRHISRYSFHSFRHTFCSMAANAGMDLSVVRSIVGHTNIAMTEHYTHYSLESKRQVINSLPLPDADSDAQQETLSVLLENLRSAKLKGIGQWLEEHLSASQKEQLRAML